MTMVNIGYLVVFQKYLCYLYLIFAINYLNSIRWVWGCGVRFQGYSFIFICVIFLSYINCLIIVFFIYFSDMVFFRYAFFAVREDDFFYLVFLLVVPLLCLSALLFHCCCYHRILQFQCLLLFNRHCQVHPYLMLSPFSGRLHLLRYPCSVIIIFVLLSSSSLITMIGVLVFILCAFPFSLSDLKSGAK